MFVYRDCKWRDLPKLIARVVRTVGMVMIMIGFSIAFGYMMAIMQIPAKATEFFVAISSDKYTFLLYVNVLLLLLGTFMDLGADAAHLHADLPAGDQAVRHRPGAFRHRHDPQSRHRPAHPCRSDRPWWSDAPSAASAWKAVSRSILIFYIPMLIVLALVTYGTNRTGGASLGQPV